VKYPILSPLARFQQPSTDGLSQGPDGTPLTHVIVFTPGLYLAILGVVATLHELLSRFLNVSDSRLKVAYVDSGSDLLVGFQCAKAVVDILRGLLSEFWERVKFQPFDDFDRKIDSLSKGLAFVGEVKAQVDNHALSDNDGRILTHRVLAEMTTLVGIGASLPQDEVVETVNHRKLLTEKRGMKLLGKGNDRSEI